MPLLQNVLPKSEFAHGARPGTSCYSAAMPHVGCTWLIHYDLADAFHQVTYLRVMKCLDKVFDVDAATAVARVVTTPIDGSRRLPQGFPTSPVVANAVFARLDETITTTLPEGWTYTRYLDDLSISTKGSMLPRDVRAVAYRMRRQIERAGWTLRREKESVCGGAERRLVAGVIVGPGEHLAAPRVYWRRLRAMLHNHKTGQPKGALDEARGLALYLAQIEPARARDYVIELDKLLNERYGAFVRNK